MLTSKQSGAFKLKTNMRSKTTVFALCLLSWLPLLTARGGVSGGSSSSSRYGDSSNYGYEVHECSTIKYLSRCSGLPYNSTSLPNTLGMSNQEDIAQKMAEFTPLTRTKCSDHLEDFLCMLHFPPCTILTEALPPCRSFCESAVTTSCLNILEQFGFPNVPILNCQKYPTSSLCIGADSTLSNETSEKPSSWEDNLILTTRTYNLGATTRPSSSETVNVMVNLFFLITRGHRIQLLDVTSINEVDTITIFNGLEPKMKALLDFYMEDKYIYWASKMDGKIFRGKLVQDELREVREIVEAANVESLAVDWLLGVLFWTEMYPPRLRTSSLSGRRETDVVTRDMIFPVSLTVDPTVGKVFWIDRRGTLMDPFATIECYELISNNRSILFNITTKVIPRSGRPRGLAADIEDKRLYWLDAKSESIHSIRYDGTDHKIVLQHSGFLMEPDSLVIQGEHVIWTDERTRSLVWANKYDGSDIVPLKTFTSHPPQNIRLFDLASQPKSNLSYNKDLLSQEWMEVSSKENMELDEYDYNEFEDVLPTRRGRPEVTDRSDKGDDDKADCGAHRYSSVSVLLITLPIVLCWFLV